MFKLIVDSDHSVSVVSIKLPPVDSYLLRGIDEAADDAAVSVWDHPDALCGPELADLNVNCRSANTTRDSVDDCRLSPYGSAIKFNPLSFSSSPSFFAHLFVLFFVPSFSCASVSLSFCLDRCGRSEGAAPDGRSHNGTRSACAVGDYSLLFPVQRDE
jgi:hypothetical protein